MSKFLKNKYVVVLSAFILAVFSLNSMTYTMDGGSAIGGASTGGDDPVCGYRVVSAVFTGDPGQITGLECYDPGSYPCEMSTLMIANPIIHALETQLVRNMQLLLIDGVTDSVYHRNIISGTTMYYGTIFWVTDTTSGTTIANTSITTP